MRMPIRYFIINRNNTVMHIQGFCPQTKSRSFPIRLFDTMEELEAYAGHSLILCKACRRARERYAKQK